MTVEAIVHGSVSGIASTGMHQLFVQLLNLSSGDQKPDYGDGQEFTEKTAVQTTNENHLNSESYASGEWPDDIPKGDIENPKPESINYTLSKEETGKES